MFFYVTVEKNHCEGCYHYTRFSKQGIILKFSFFFGIYFDGSDYDEWEAYIWNNIFLLLFLYTTISKAFVILISYFLS